MTDDFLFDAVSGEIGVLEGSDVLIELGGVFARQDDVLSKKAVFECVFGGAGFSAVGAGPG